MGLVANYDFILRPKVKPTASFDSRYRCAVEPRNQYRTDRASAAIASDEEERNIRGTERFERSFERVMLANMSSKHDPDDEMNNPSLSTRWTKPIKRSQFYMAKKRLDPKTANALIAKGAKRLPTATRNVYIIMSSGKDMTIYGMVAYPTAKSRASKRHQH